MPYLRAKAADYFEALGGGIDTELFDEGASNRQNRLLAEDVCILVDPMNHSHSILRPLWRNCADYS